MTNLKKHTRQLALLVDDSYAQSNIKYLKDALFSAVNRPLPKDDDYSNTSSTPTYKFIEDANTGTVMK